MTTSISELDTTLLDFKRACQRKGTAMDKTSIVEDNFSTQAELRGVVAAVGSIQIRIKSGVWFVRPDDYKLPGAYGYTLLEAVRSLAATAEAEKAQES